MKYVYFFFFVLILLFLVGNLIAFFDGVYSLCDIGFRICDESGALSLMDLFAAKSLLIHIISSLVITGLVMARDNHVKGERSQ